MPKTLIKLRFFSSKLKQNPKPQKENNTSILHQNLQIFERKLMSGIVFLTYK